MKRSDIQVGKRYQVNKGWGSYVTCRVISKHLFGFLIKEVHGARWDVGYPTYQSYGHTWSWRVLERFD